MYWKRRQDNFSNVLWLTIDKKSMLTTPNLLLLSKTIGVVRSGLQSTVPSIPLGGMSTILLGDFHQFPLISSKQNTLYCTSVVKDNPQLGRALYKQFDIVIKLEEQMRITDQVWVDILWQSQTGDCTREDISEIKRLVLLNPGCEIPNCTESPWSNAVIVTLIMVFTCFGMNQCSNLNVAKWVKSITFFMCTTNTKTINCHTKKD